MKVFHIHRLSITLATALALCASGAGAMAAPAGGMDALPFPRTPPALDYARICAKPLVAGPLAIDWHAWSGSPVDLPPAQIYADAIRLIDGGSEVARDLPLARRMLETLVADGAAGSVEAKRRLALLLLDRRAGALDEDRATRLLIEATASQETDAALSLGRLIARGSLPALSLEDAARYLGIAAGFGEPMAALELSSLYATGRLAEPFEGAAAHFANLATINLQTALARGECNHAAEVGQFLIDTGLPEAPSLAIAWFEIGAGAGNRSALEKLARAHQQGIGVKRDTVEARKLWEKAIAAGSIVGLAAAAELDLVAGRNLDQAEQLLTKGMANSDPTAYLMAARLYRGDFTGTADFTRMQAVLEEAAAKPDASVFTLDSLATAYLSGQGVERDPAKAKDLYQRILRTNTPDAQGLYGRYLLKWGLGLDEAVQNLRQSEDAGSTLVTTTLADVAACLPHQGLDAAALLKKAADSGNALAQRKLARRTLEAGDKPGARLAFETAAGLGDRIAMVEQAMAMIAENGRSGKATEALLNAAAAPGDGVISGRLALIQAYRSGRLGKDDGKSLALLESLGDSLDPTVDVMIAKDRLEGTALTVAGDDTRLRLERASAMGNGEAMLLLSRSLAQDEAAAAQAAEWLIRAAERGNASAMAELPVDPQVLTRVTASLRNVMLCDIDSLVAKARLQRLLGDMESAADTLDQAETIAAPSSRQLFALGQALITLSPSQAGDGERAAAVLAKSAGAGSGKAALVLAKLYDGGRLGPQTAQAINWFEKAALSGEPSAIPELARLSKGGAETGAVQALATVAETGNASALRSLGMLLVTQDSSRRDEGIRLLEQAADHKDIAAMKILARLHASGIDGQVSAAKSTDWTRMAAEQGDPEAMYQYAIALDLGFGVNSDPQSAKSWHQKALQNGFVQ